jgi:hypothetical protein
VTLLLLLLVGAVTDYGLDGTASIADRGRDLSLLHSVRTGSGAHPASCPGGWGGAISPGVKRPGREADPSPPSIAEVKNDGAIPPLRIRFHGIVLN